MIFFKINFKLLLGNLYINMTLFMKNLNYIR